MQKVRSALPHLLYSFMGQLNLFTRTVSTNLTGNKVKLKELLKNPKQTTKNCYLISICHFAKKMI